MFNHYSHLGGLLLSKETFQSLDSHIAQMLVFCFRKWTVIFQRLPLLTQWEASRPLGSLIYSSHFGFWRPSIFKERQSPGSHIALILGPGRPAIFEEACHSVTSHIAFTIERGPPY